MNHEIITASPQLVSLTQAAQAHFAGLLATESAKEPDGISLNLRISVSNPGTLKADIGITFCPIGDEEAGDIAITYPRFKLYIEQGAVKFLREAVIDYKANDFGGQLSVKAPFIKGLAPKKDASLRERVQYIIDSEINPNLASHGGFVSVVAVEDGGIVVLRFGGGCHGCGMADVTLKSGIEKTLLQQCEDITAVKDVTDHSQGENPYYT